MVIGFWNIHNKNDSTIKRLLFEWSEEYDLDIIILLESSMSVAEILPVLNQINRTRYFVSPSYLADSYFTVFTKLPPEYSLPEKERNRIESRRIIDPTFGDFSLIMVHYQSRLHWSDNDQDAHSPTLKRFMDELETQVGHDRTLLLGDFNMNPFQTGMVQTTGLHATMDRRVAELGSRIVDGDYYKFLYNPMWSFFGEKGAGEVNGTYFNNSAKPISYFWNIFDQVILRPSLLAAFDEDSLQILTRIGATNLLNQSGRIKNGISDHLPIVFNLNLNFLSHATRREPLATDIR